MTRFLHRPSSRGTALAALCVLALAACGSAQPHGGPVLESSTARPVPSGSPTGPAADPGTCFDVAGLYTSLTLVPLSTDEADPHFHPEQAVASAQEAARGMPEELRPAFHDAVDRLRAAGESVQPAELAALRRTLDPVDEWLQRRCPEPAPTH